MLVTLIIITAMTMRIANNSWHYLVRNFPTLIGIGKRRDVSSSVMTTRVAARDDDELSFLQILAMASGFPSGEGSAFLRDCELQDPWLISTYALRSA